MDKDPIRIFNISYSDKDKTRIHELVDRVIDEAFLTNHTLCRELEEKVNSLQKSLYSIATSSATTGLEAVFRTINVRNKAVIVQANTFIATAHAIQAAGGIIVPLDLSKEYVASYNDLLRAYAKCNELDIEVAAICVVNISGRASEKIFKIKEFSEEHNIVLVEDNAQGFLSSINNKFLGTIGNYSVTSFQTTKVVACGEGGIINCDNEERQVNIRNNIFFGKSKSIPRLFDYESGNFKLSEMNAALAIADLERCKDRIKRRQEINAFYKENVKSKFIKFLPSPKGNISSNYKTLFVANDPLITKGIEMLFKEKRIAMTGSVYREPISVQPRVIESRKYLARELTNTAKFCNCHFAPPNYPELKDEEISRIVDTLNKFVS